MKQEPLPQRSISGIAFGFLGTALIVLGLPACLLDTLLTEFWSYWRIDWTDQAKDQLLMVTIGGYGMFVVAGFALLRGFPNGQPRPNSTIWVAIGLLFVCAAIADLVFIRPSFTTP